ncbi:hypothetical protein [Nostoc sp.]|uniref:hypothetical protein n=1 Tax=Nostoc sp. TaxID=1180 RepID=UPI002FFC585B
MIESTLYTTLSTNEEANLSGGGKRGGDKSGGGNKTTKNSIYQNGNMISGNSINVAGGNSIYINKTEEPKSHW